MFNLQPLQLSWDCQLKASPEQLWPFVADTNRLFKDLNQLGIRSEKIEKAGEFSFSLFSSSYYNQHKSEIEEPCEWEYPFRLGISRDCQSGPYKKFNIQVDLLPNDKGTLFQIKFWAKPKGDILSLFATYVLNTLLKLRLKNVIKTYDRLACKNLKPFQTSKEKRLASGSKKRINQIKETLRKKEVDMEIVENIIDFLRKADDLELRQIHPNILADCWSISEQKVLTVFFHAAKAGLLSLQWELICPDCRRPQKSLASLNQIHEPVYCDDCQQNFRVNFSNTIRLSFIPNPVIRKISYDKYCTQGPRNQPHIFIKQHLKPGESCYLKMNLPEGVYSLKTNTSKGTAEICVDQKGEHTIGISLTNSGLNGERACVIPDPNLSITNESLSNQIVTLEQKAWNKEMITAAKATSSQLFRNLFDDQILKMGEKIAVDNLTLMFTDLFDSTGIYKKQGDDVALGHVINHFQILQHTVKEEGGAIVKTIGDSAMAGFCEPAQALRAFLRAKKMLSEDNSTLLLKAGIHHGKCIAVNLHSRIDYFGSTVNIASRFVDYASENEIIISQDTSTQVDIQQVLRDFDHQLNVSDTTASLKGFEDDIFRLKTIRVDSSPLRLVV